MTSFPPQIKPPAIAAYLLLIEPRKDLADSINAVKQAFCEKYNAPEAIKGKPHLTLVSYVQYIAFENRIRQRLRQIALEKAPVMIELSDYGSFPSHTIFLNVVSRAAVQSLVTKIRTGLQAMMKLDKDNKPHFIMEPHITIARRLKPWQYEQGWLEYSNKHFTGRFIATGMVLLRKEADAPKYSLVERFEFLDMPVSATQAMLF